MTTHSRRQLLRTGALGAAATAVLVACGTKSDSKSGLSGASATTSVVEPTVPETDPKPSALENDITLLRTATSLELLAADVYAEQAGRLTDATWVATATRFGEDHRAAAAAFRDETPDEFKVDEPNQFLLDNFVAATEGNLLDDPAIFNHLRSIENAITATYNNATGQYTNAAGRANFGAHASASAGRAAALGNGGKGEAPTSAVFSTKDLIPNAAYVLAVPAPVESQTAVENTTEGDGS